MPKIVTLSSLWLVAICPGAAALPWVGSVSPSAALGSALHEAMQAQIEAPDTTVPTPDEIALAWDLDEDQVRRFFFLLEAFRPKVPEGALAEVALALYPDGAVRRVQGARGEYDAPGAIFAGSIDCIWSEPERLTTWNDADQAETPPGSMVITTDWKFGDEGNVPPVARNLQALGEALLGARWTRAESAIAGLCFGQPGMGRWEQKLLEPDDLDEVELQIREVLHHAEEARLAVAAGDTPRLVTGAHCEHCPARMACPAYASEVRALVMAPPANVTLPIAREHAARAAELLPVARRIVESLEQIARDGADHFGPLQLASGKVYGPGREERAMFATRATYEALAEVVGEELADGAFRTTKEGIKDALREGAAPRGSFQRLLERLEANGALTKRILQVYRARHVAPALPPAAPMPVELGGLGPLEDEKGDAA